MKTSDLLKVIKPYVMRWISNAALVRNGSLSTTELDRRYYQVGTAPGDGLVDLNALEIDVGEGPGLDVTEDAVGLGGDMILLYDSGGDPVAEYAATDSGLTSALAAMAAGDVCWLPAATITGGPWTLANGTLRGVSREESILDGQITLSDDTSLENLSIVRSVNTTTDTYGAVSDSGGSGSCKIINCHISVTNAGGVGVGIDASSGTTLGTSVTDPGLLFSYIRGSNIDVM